MRIVDIREQSIPISRYADDTIPSGGLTTSLVAVVTDVERSGAQRERAKDPQFQAVYRQHRPMGERSISWLVAEGNRRLRFVGTRLNDLWLHHRVAALNLRRLLVLGLTRSTDSWVLAPT